MRQVARHDRDGPHLRPSRALSGTFSLCALLAICLTGGLTGAAQTAGNLVNLNDILVHQRALVRQCQLLEREQMAELEELLEFERATGQQLHANERLTLKLPAVCLLLLGPPEFGSANVSAARAEQAEAQSLRLDLVNWIYDYDELAARLQSAQPSRTGERIKRADGSLLADNATGLLADYWLDLNKVVGDQTTGEAELPEEQRKFNEQMARVLDADSFEQATRLEGQRLAGYLSPVILVPGLAGSRLQVRVVGGRPKVNIICSKQTGWQDVWLALRWFLPVAIDCWLDNARLEFDPVSGFVREPPGVESRVPDFGSVESVRHLDLNSPKLTKYFHAIIERYEKLGYQPDRNLFAAPYDFRLAPQQLEAPFFERLRKLVEFASSSGGREPLTPSSLESPAAGARGASQKVTLVCHSMGCTHLLVFLRAQPAGWRQARIRKLIALSSPWAGTVKALKALLVGEQFGLPIISEAKMRKLARTFPSVAYLLPQPEVFARPNKNELEFGAQVLVQTGTRAYRVDELEQLLRDAGLELQWNWFKETAALIRPLEPLPDLRVDCIHSLNIPTPETIIFREASNSSHETNEIIQADGDGTVNHQSLLVCGRWAVQLPHKVTHKIVPNTSHMGILSHKQILEHITQDVLSRENRD